MERNQGSIVATLGVGVTLVVVLVLLVFFVFGKIVPPDQIGIRRNLYGFGLQSKGYQAVGLKPGLHWKLPYVSEIDLIPKTFQFVHFNAEAEPGELSLSQLNVPTADGSKVNSDLTLVLRYFTEPSAGSSSTLEPTPLELESGGRSVGIPLPSFPEVAHGGPADLYSRYTASSETQLIKFSQLSEDALKQALSQLSTTDYYNPNLREGAALAAQTRVNQEVNVAGIELWGALIRRYSFADRDIDDQIFQKNLQEQTEQLNAARSEREAEKAQTERVLASWDAKIAVLKTEGETNAKVIRSEGDLFEAEKMAQADLLVAQSKAEVDAAKAGVLSGVSGAQVYVAREMVPLLRTLEGGTVSGLDPFDIGRWVQKLVGAEVRQ